MTQYSDITLYSSEPGARIFMVILPDTSIEKLVVLPHFNRGIKQSVIDAARQTPSFRELVEKGSFVITGEVEVKGLKDGQETVDHKELGETKVVTDQATVLSPVGKKYMPTLDTLMSYQGVGKSTAQKMLALAPKGGWDSQSAFKEAVAHFEIDFTPKNKKPADL